MLLVLGDVVGIDEDVVEVDDHIDVEEIREDVVHETLESCRSVGESEGHNRLFKGTITGTEGGFPLIAIRNLD